MPEVCPGLARPIADRGSRRSGPPELEKRRYDLRVRIASLLCAVAACGGGAAVAVDAPITGPGRCSIFEGTTYQSVNAMTCGPSDTPPCRWTLRFSAADATDTAFESLIMDVDATGTLQCSGVVIVGTTPALANGASYDVESDVITWDGTPYSQ